MHQRFIAALGALAVIGGGTLWYIGQERTAPALRPSLTTSAFASTRVDPEARDREIAWFQERAAEDPYSAGDRARLATLFLQRARATGNYDDVLRAEAEARRSLELRTSHNAGTYQVLAIALLDQHRFRDAFQAAQTLVQLDPEPPVHRALLGETQMELGRYDEARVTFGSLEPAQNDLNVAPRLARWAEISGQTDRARKLLYAARDQALARPDVGLEQRVVFHYRVAEFELRNGRLQEAEAALRAGLALRPNDHRLLAEMTRLEALQHRWKEAIGYGERAISAVLDPATLGVMSDAYAALGDSESAAEYAKVMEVSTLNQAGSFHREWSIFLLDHGDRIPEVSNHAAEEIRTRRDVYGYDLLAWALYKQGRNAEARKAAVMALRMGTRDPLLLYHAGMIERAAGDDGVAKAYLRQALEINPQFHPTHPATARAVLDSIGGRSWRLPFWL